MKSLHQFLKEKLSIELIKYKGDEIINLEILDIEDDDEQKVML